jgi:hypothetical protein
MFRPLSEHIEEKLENAFYNKYMLLTYEDFDLWEGYKTDFAIFLVGQFGDVSEGFNKNF